MNENENYNYKKLTPFKFFCLQNFPFIEANFDAINNYELLCKIVEYLNKTITTTNSLGEEVEELSNRLTNLNLQEEVNKKLDIMATDGTLANIINQDIFNDLNTKVDDNYEALESLIEANELKFENYKKSDSYISFIRQFKNLYKFVIWSENVFNNNFFGFNNIYFNGEHYVEDSEEYFYWDTNGHNTYYINPKGLESNSGLSPDQPNNNFSYLYDNVLKNGDTVILQSGYYTRENWLNKQSPITKNLRIIGEDDVYISDSDKSLVWTQSAISSNVWQCSRTAIYQVIDIRNIKNNSTNLLTKLDNLDEVVTNENSYYYDGSTIYVHMKGNVKPTYRNLITNLSVTSTYFEMISSTASLSCVLDNLTFIGGYGGNVVVKTKNQNYGARLNIRKCRFFNAFTTSKYPGNGINVLGGSLVAKDCLVSFAQKDGFNYHQFSNRVPYAYEINCISSYNGTRDNTSSNQGSSVHDGGYIIRMNGKYFGNGGANIKDINSGTISININCKAYDSNSIDNNENCDFEVAENGKMYLYNCITQYSNSLHNIISYNTNSNLFYNNCTYDTISNATKILPPSVL